MIKNDEWIIKMAKEQGMIEPFEGKQVRSGVISYGVSSFGYDVRITDEFKVVTVENSVIIDPKNFRPEIMSEQKADYCIIPPNSYILGRSLEYFRIPPKVLALCFGKSTYARCGVVANITPLEPGWEGFITMAIANTAPLPVKIYAGEGIAQIIFIEADEPPSVSYKDKKGKYQAQKNLTYAKV